MQKILKYLFLFILVQGYSYADIYEIYNLSEISRSVNDKTLLLFDIDDTLIHTEIAFGSHKWDEFIKAALKGDRSKEYVPLLWYTMRNVPFIAVETSTPSLIASFQKNGTCVMGLTVRHPISVSPTKPELNLTKHQLERAGIQLGLDIKSKVFGLDSSVEDGVIFCSGKPKGQTLVDLFHRVGIYPAKVVFVDDKHYHVNSVNNALKDAGIPCDCYWYRRIEQKLTSIDPWVALKQFEHFILEGVILSDKDAKKLVDQELNEGFSPEEYLLNLMDFYDPLSTLKIAM